MGGLLCYTYLKDGRRFTPASFWGAQNEFKTCGFAAVFFVSMYSLKQAWLVQKTKKPRNYVVLNSLAEREGFEPPDLLQSIVFKTIAIDHSAISPRQM